MISKNQIKTIRSLENKKGRTTEKAFVAEGPKVVADLAEFSRPRLVVATNEWMERNPEFTARLGCNCIDVTEDELRKVSFLQHPQQVLAVFPIENNEGNEAPSVDNELYIALDGVQDPGNLGTIIRIADWFGISRIFCSRDTADVYNPKVIQATMGSVARVKVEYVDLVNMIKTLPSSMPVFGTFLDGENIYEKNLPQHGIIVMGNEGKGISDDIKALVTEKLLIPNFPEGRRTADSLNVAIATAITCSEFRRGR